MYSIDYPYSELHIEINPPPREIIPPRMINIGLEEYQPIRVSAPPTIPVILLIVIFIYYLLFYFLVLHLYLR